MKKIKRIIKIVAFICFLLLAGVGVGISGGVPIPFSKIRRDAEKDNTELIEEEENADAEQGEIKG